MYHISFITYFEEIMSTIPRLLNPSCPVHTYITIFNRVLIKAHSNSEEYHL